MRPLLSAFLTARAFLIGVAVALLVGLGLGYWLHGAPAVPTVTRAVAAVHTAERHRDSVAVVVQHDTHTVVRLLAPLSLALTTLDVHDTASVIRLATAARAVAPACRDVVTSCAALHAADLAVIAAKDREISARAALAPHRLTLYAEGLYDPLVTAQAARLGTAIRLPANLSGIVELEAERDARDPGSPVRGRVWLGGRYTFH